MLAPLLRGSVAAWVKDRCTAFCERREHTAMIWSTMAVGCVSPNGKWLKMWLEMWPFRSSGDYLKTDETHSGALNGAAVQISSTIRHIQVEPVKWMWMDVPCCFSVFFFPYIHAFAPRLSPTHRQRHTCTGLSLSVSRWELSLWLVVENECLRAAVFRSRLLREEKTMLVLGHPPAACHSSSGADCLCPQLGSSEPQLPFSAFTLRVLAFFAVQSRFSNIFLTKITMRIQLDAYCNNSDLRQENPIATFFSSITPLPETRLCYVIGGKELACSRRSKSLLFPWKIQRN